MSFGKNTSRINECRDAGYKITINYTGLKIKHKSF